MDSCATNILRLLIHQNVMNKFAIIVAVWIGISVLLTIISSLLLYKLSGTFDYWFWLTYSAGFFMPYGTIGAVIQGIMSKANYFGIASFWMASLTVGTLTLISAYILTLFFIDESAVKYLTVVPTYLCALISYTLTK